MTDELIISSVGDTALKQCLVQCLSHRGPRGWRRDGGVEGRRRDRGVEGWRRDGGMSRRADGLTIYRTTKKTDGQHWLDFSKSIDVLLI